MIGTKRTRSAVVLAVVFGSLALIVASYAGETVTAPLQVSITKVERLRDHRRYEQEKRAVQDQHHGLGGCGTS